MKIGLSRNIKLDLVESVEAEHLIVPRDERSFNNQKSFEIFAFGL